MTTMTAKIAMPGATLAFVLAAATPPDAPHIGARARAGRAISIDPEAVRDQVQVRQLRSRGKVVS